MFTLEKKKIGLMNKNLFIKDNVFHEIEFLFSCHFWYKVHKEIMEETYNSTLFFTKDEI